MTRLVVALLLGLLSTSAASAQMESVSELINAYDFEVVGVFPSSAGPGILLQQHLEGKDKVLVMCFVAETPDSADIATQYCKPVH